MAVKPKEVKEEVKEEMQTSEGISLTEPRVKIYYRDIATRWPAGDKNAENPVVVENDLTRLMNEGWNLELSHVVGTKTIGDMTDEFVISTLFILTK